ncbi:hypothetical protein LJR074_003417 [Acidovorax sp. LjRoot74]|uniref:hypothetical protein n=1 Tax=Acidovorax sp. LjRoot74 TaxID=3342337 RepID=UPI003ECFF2FE
MDSEKGALPKKSLKTLHLHAKPATEEKAPEPAGEIIAPYILDRMLPKTPPAPISMRLEQIRSESDDDLMKWLTTESAHPTRPLDEGTKMAITTELMRRQAMKFERPPWWKDRNYLIALIAAIGGVIAAVPVVVDWLKK